MICGYETISKDLITHFGSAGKQVVAEESHFEVLDCCECTQLATLSRIQRKGLGSAIVEHMKEICQNSNVGLCLETFESVCQKTCAIHRSSSACGSASVNVRKVKFYQTRGFKLFWTAGYEDRVDLVKKKVNYLTWYANEESEIWHDDDDPCGSV